MYNEYYTIPKLSGCTFAGNSADLGGAIYDDYQSGSSLANCILWSDASPVIYPNRMTVVKYSAVQDGWPGMGNIDADPCFIDPGHWDTNGTPDDVNDDFWVDGDYHLRPDSPCINAGDPNLIAGPNDVDMDGGKRVMLGRIDMGADEFNPFSADFIVVRKTRVDRTIFEYECQVVLENISRFAISNISLEMADSSANMTIIDQNVTFGDHEVGPGESATSVDTCTFIVDRSEAIDPAEIIWHVTAELAKTGVTIQHTISTPLPPDSQTDLHGLKELAEKWLWQGPAGAIDEDSVPDGTVNLADFAKFADQWIKK